MNRSPLVLATFLLGGLAAGSDTGQLAAPHGVSTLLPGQSRFEIMDGAHSGGTMGFYFLPPLVAEPRDTSAFDSTRAVVVRVCALGNPAAASCKGGV